MAYRKKSHRTTPSNRATIKSSYKYTGGIIPYEDYYKFINDFLKYIAKKAIEDAKVIILPSGIGNLFIRGVKMVPKFNDDGTSNMLPDWKATKELWAKDPEAKKEKRLIFLFNDHTRNYMFQFKWDRSIMLPKAVRNHYFFVLTRTNKRLMAKLIKEGKEYAT